MRDRSVGEKALLIREARARNKKEYSNSCSHSVQLCGAEKHVRMHKKTLVGLQHHTPVSSVIQEGEFDLKLDSWKEKKHFPILFLLSSLGDGLRFWFLADRSDRSVILCCCRPFTFKVLCVLRCFYTHYGCKECYSELL